MGPAPQGEKSRTFLCRGTCRYRLWSQSNCGRFCEIRHLHTFLKPQSSGTGPAPSAPARGHGLVRAWPLPLGQCHQSSLTEDRVAQGRGVQARPASSALRACLLEPELPRGPVDAGVRVTRTRVCWKFLKASVLVLHIPRLTQF